jgi:hypothetical protein
MSGLDKVDPAKWIETVFGLTLRTRSEKRNSGAALVIPTHVTSPSSLGLRRFRR